MSELSELRASLAEYEEQLAEVDEALKVDPKSTEHAEMRKDLVELIELSRETIAQLVAASVSNSKPQQSSATRQPPPPPAAARGATVLRAKSELVSELDGWKTGDKCRTVYLEDGQKYVAVINGFRREARSAMVTFVGYLNQQETPLEYLERVAEEAVPRAEVAAVAAASERKRTKGDVAAPVILPTDTPEVIARKKKLIKSMKRSEKIEEKTKEQVKKTKSWRDFQKLGKPGLTMNPVGAHQKKAPSVDIEGAARVRKKWKHVDGVGIAPEQQNDSDD